MMKIPTLFVRDDSQGRRFVLDKVTPGCEWVIDGAGVPTRKYDGTCTLVRDGKLFMRREVGKGRTIPLGFEEIDHDPVTGKTVGWEMVEMSGFSKYALEAFHSTEKWDGTGFRGKQWTDGTYELCGPKINGNPEKFEHHTLVPHGATQFTLNVPTNFEGLREYLQSHPFEGIVWHHPDGRMAKLKKRDFPKP